MSEETKETQQETVDEELKDMAEKIKEEGKAADEATAAEEAVADAKTQVDEAVAEMQKKYTRLQADFANFKKRTATEKLQISEVVKADVIESVLPVIDNFERALQVPQDKLTDDVKSFMSGYEMIYKQLLQVLEKEGVKKIDAKGKPFDPNFHQAVMRVPSDEYDDDVVVEVLQEGYTLGDKTLRPAMVKVAFNG